MAKVIIIDDIFNTRVVLKQFIESAGHKVIANFGDAIEAYDFFNYMDSPPDIVLLDYNLKSFKDGKNYTGIDLLSDIKAINREIKVILISAFAEADIIKNAMVNGASDFIVKPFDSEDLINRINKALH
ncbi:MAG: response regulator [Spirochaetes bacterium]|nr:response regulator [Spirochaetota bacterium]